MLGFQDTRELLGRHMHNLMHHHRPDGTPYPVEECRIYQAFRAGLGEHVTDEVSRAPTARRFQSSTGLIRCRREGKLVGCVVSFLDITERINREQELIRARQSADLATQAAAAKLESIQLQVRELLGGLTGITAQLEGTQLSHEQQSQLEAATTSGPGVDGVCFGWYFEMNPTW